MITFAGGSKFAKGGPNPLASLDSRGSISASGFGPGGPNPGGSKSARTPGLLCNKHNLCVCTLSGMMFYSAFYISYL